MKVNWLSFCYGCFIAVGVCLAIAVASFGFRSIDCQNTRDTLTETRQAANGILAQANQCNERVGNIQKYCKCECDMPKVAPPPPPPPVPKAKAAKGKK